jgi:thiamine kinase-like enzyme
MKFKIKGHSGCDIRIEEKQNRLVVIKSTRDLNYFDRLIKQANKQIEFSKQQFDEILTPEVYNISNSNEKIEIEMELIYSQNFLDFFDYSSFGQLSKFINKTIRFINKEISCCEHIEIDKRIILDKIQDIKTIFKKNKLISDDERLIFHINDIENIIYSTESIILPVGMCHGDLTFSNILFSGNSIYLIDFLDSFIESPIMDIIKLRQDTAYYWSLNMIEDDFDTTRTLMLFKYLDDIINKEFKKHDFYNKYYVLFQKINFLRILQYAKSENIVNFIKPILDSLKISNE